MWLSGRSIRRRWPATVRVPDPQRLVHLQFRRYAGCPVCNSHLRSIVERHDEILAAGIAEVVFFHSTAEEVRSYNEDVPLPVIADPNKRVYREFGVESSARAVLDPRAWRPLLKSIVGKRRPLSGDHRSGHFGLAADFLVATDGRVLAAKYGKHAYDHRSVDEILDLAAEHG
jgi:hypothetical protein